MLRKTRTENHRPVLWRIARRRRSVVLVQRFVEPGRRIIAPLGKPSNRGGEPLSAEKKRLSRGHGRFEAIGRRRQEVERAREEAGACRGRPPRDGVTAGYG